MIDTQVQAFKTHTLSLRYLIAAAKTNPKEFTESMIKNGLVNDIPLLISLYARNSGDHYFAAEKYFDTTKDKKGQLNMLNAINQTVLINRAILENALKNYIGFLSLMIQTGKQKEIPLFSQMVASTDNEYYLAAKAYYQSTQDKEGVKRILQSFGIWEREDLIKRFESEVIIL